MSRQRNKLAPEGVAAQAGNFLMNIVVAVGWLLRRIAEALTGKKRK